MTLNNITSLIPAEEPLIVRDKNGVIYQDESNTIDYSEMRKLHGERIVTLIKEEDHAIVLEIE